MCPRNNLTVQSDDEVQVVEPSTKTRKSNHVVEVKSDDDADFQPPQLRGAAATATAAPSSVPLRRSTRTRTQTKQLYEVSDDAVRSTRRRRARAGSSKATTEAEEEEENHLDQISLEDGGAFRMRVHPCAMSLMQLHVHLSKTEVIGYLGGFTLDDGLIDVAEAFPAVCVEPKELTRTGRSAYREVEMQPESDVLLRARIESKGLSVVGWYHSHPDRRFTVEPSRVDIENQHNYQQYIFRERPFVAAILAPYNEDLPDAVGAMDAFYVEGEEKPLRVPYAIEYAVRPPSPMFASYQSHLGVNNLPDAALEAEALALIIDGAKFRQRVHMLSEWRDGVRFIDKMRECMAKLLPECEPDDTLTASNNDRLITLFAQFVSLAEQVWPPSPQRKTANKKRRRKGKWS